MRRLPPQESAFLLRSALLSARRTAAQALDAPRRRVLARHRDRRLLALVPLRGSKGRGAHRLEEPALRRVDVVFPVEAGRRLHGDALVGDVEALVLQSALLERELSSSQREGNDGNPRFFRVVDRL